LKGASVLDLYNPDTAESIRVLNGAFARGTLESVRGQGVLHLSGGDAVELEGWTRRFEGISPRPLIVTSAVDARSETSTNEGYWVVRAGTLVFGPLAGDSAPERAARHRAEQLKRHLWRIELELRAAGLLPASTHNQNADLVRKVADLSARQREIVSRLLAGERVPEIAKAIYLSPTTVRNHLTAVFRKFGVHSQVELLAVLKRNDDPHLDRDSIDLTDQSATPPR
jgi:DNA-binding CsgD family transcriptional regulator